MKEVKSLTGFHSGGILTHENSLDVLSTTFTEPIFKI